MDKRIEEALTYLTETDEEYGRLKGHKAGLEHRLKVCRATETLKAEGKSMAERECRALASEPYKVMVNIYEDCVIDLEIMGAKRKKEELVIDVWRTINANQRRGNI